MAPDRPGDKGAVLESRLARLLYWEGGSVRRRVNLESHFREKFTITDVDVLSFSFGPDLRLSTTAAEAKSTEAKNSPNAADRLLWLTGIRQLTGADHAVLCTSRHASAAIRDLAERLAVEVIDERDLSRRESLLGLSEPSTFLIHDPRRIGLEREVFETAKRDEDLRRVYWFSRSELWLAAPVPALKKALGAARVLSNRWSDRLPDVEQRCVKHLAHEVLVGCLISLTRLAGVAYRQPEDVFAEWMSQRLAEGLAEYHALEAMSAEFDKLLLASLRDAGLDPSRAVRSLGALAPQPPAYTESLVEVLLRLAAAPGSTRQIARLADWNYAPRVDRDRTPDAFLDASDANRLLRLVGTFLEGQVHVTPNIFAALSPAPSKSAIDRNGSAPVVPQDGDLAAGEIPHQLTIDRDSATAAAEEPASKPSASAKE